MIQCDEDHHHTLKFKMRNFEVHLWRIILSSDTAAPWSSSSRYFCRGPSVIIVIIIMHEDFDDVYDYADDDHCDKHDEDFSNDFNDD